MENNLKYMAFKDLTFKDAIEGVEFWIENTKNKKAKATLNEFYRLVSKNVNDYKISMPSLALKLNANISEEELIKTVYQTAEQVVRAEYGNSLTEQEFNNMVEEMADIAAYEACFVCQQNDVCIKRGGTGFSCTEIKSHRTYNHAFNLTENGLDIESKYSYAEQVDGRLGSVYTTFGYKHKYVNDVCVEMEEKNISDYLYYGEKYEETRKISTTFDGTKVKYERVCVEDGNITASEEKLYNKDADQVLSFSIVKKQNEFSL